MFWLRVCPDLVTVALMKMSGRIIPDWPTYVEYRSGISELFLPNLICKTGMDMYLGQVTLSTINNLLLKSVFIQQLRTHS